MISQSRRVVITGLGIISPIGNDIHSNWNNLILGKSGISNITKFNASNLSTRFAGEVKNFNIRKYIPNKESRHMDLFIQYGVAAGIQAIFDSNIEITEKNSDRIGVMVGSGIGSLPMIEKNKNNLLNSKFNRISPFFISSSMINMISSYLSIKLNLKGPNIAITTACATGLHCIGEAYRLIKYNNADVMLAGSSESIISPIGISSFSASRSLSKRNHDPKTASRPWDKDRDGFVLSEGAGVIVLEEYIHAKTRSAKIYSELIGYGISSDAYHITAPLKCGDGASRCMLAALKNAKINLNQVDYLNAHGTSTILGDISENNGIKKTFGEYANNITISSTKSITGHLLGASGSVESIYTILAIYNQIAPPTINIFNLDKDFNLDYCANFAKEMHINIALKNSFGFGGTNVSLLFKKI